MSLTQVRQPMPENFAIRRPRSTDSQALREFLTGLSSHSRYLRFFSGAAPASQAMLRVLAGQSGRADVLVATMDGIIVGHGMASDTAGPGRGHLTELGVVVADGYRGLGVGSGLIRHLVARAEDRGATGVVMEVLAENRQVLAMIADHWPQARQERCGAYVTIHAGLSPRPRRWPGLWAAGWPALEPPPPRPEEEHHDERLAGLR